MNTWTPDQWLTMIGGSIGAYYGWRFVFMLVMNLFGGIEPTKIEVTAEVLIKHDDE